MGTANPQGPTENTNAREPTGAAREGETPRESNPQGHRSEGEEAARESGGAFRIHTARASASSGASTGAAGGESEKIWTLRDAIRALAVRLHPDRLHGHEVERVRGGGGLRGVEK